MSATATQHKSNGKAPVNGRLRKPTDLLDAPDPHDLDAEQAWLSAKFYAGRKYDDAAERFDEAAETLQPGDFHSHPNRRIFEAMRDVWEDGGAPDLASVVARLRADGAIDQAGGIDYLHGLAEAASTGANVDHFARIIKRKSDQRRVVNAGRRFIQIGHDDHRAVGDNADWWAEVAEAAEGIKPRRTARRSPQVYDVSELMKKEFPPTRWAVEGIIPADLTLLAAAPKIGKTWMTLGIGAAKVMGGMALGKIPVTRGSVLYLALEDPDVRLQRRFDKLLASEGGQIPPGFSVAHDWPRTNEGGLEMLDEWLESQTDPLVFVDTLTKFRAPRQRGANCYDEDYAAVDGLHQLAIKHRAPIIVNVHTRKGKSQADDIIEEISGTLGLSGAADTILVLGRERGKGDAVLHVTGRDVEERQLALSFDPRHGLWTLMGDAAEFAGTKLAGQIVTTLKEAGRPMKPAEVARAIDKNSDKDRGAVRQAMKRLADRGTIKAEGDGSYKYITPVTCHTPFSDTVTGVTGFKGGNGTDGE